MSETKLTDYSASTAVLKYGMYQIKVTKELLTETLRKMNDLHVLEQIVARAENKMECEQIKLDL